MKKLTEIIARVFHISRESITDSLSYQEIEAWDSVNHLKLVSEMESAFGIEFDIEEITAMENVGKIKETLRKHGVKEP